MKIIEWPERTKGFLLLLLLLFVTAAFLLKEEPAYTLTTEEAWEPEAAGVNDAGAEDETVSLLTEEEQIRLQKEALKAAEYCRELYKDSKAAETGAGGDSSTFRLSGEQQAAMTARLGKLGLVSVSDNINMENHEKAGEFYSAYREGKDALITVYYVYPEGGISALTFVYRKNELQTYFTAIGWDEGGNPEIRGSGTNHLKEIKLTEKGYLSLYE